MGKHIEMAFSSKDGKARIPLKWSTSLIISMVFVSLAFNVAWLSWLLKLPESSSHVELLRFSSYLELKAFLNNTAPSLPYYYGLPGLLKGDRLSVFTEDSGANGRVEYSRTNIQVEGVDEADIVKCDGEYLYISNEKRVLIVKAYPPEEAKVSAEIDLNGTVVGLFVNGDRLAIFEVYYEVSPILPLKKTDWIYGSPFTSILVYDIEDRENPVLVRTVSSDGGYFASRMIGDYVYLIATRGAYILNDDVPLPIIVKDGKVEVVEATNIHYVNVTDYWYQFTTIVAVNVKDDSVEPVYETILVGGSSGVYVSLNNIYLAVPQYNFEDGSETTEVYRIRIDGNFIKAEASGQVPGRILNQFSMDEHEGNFRIATTTGYATWSGELTSSNHVYVLDMNLTIIGRLENLAKGETIYAARFLGERCYLVTFKKVDPLFAISLEDPTNPRVLGQLKIPGYSDYLHPYSENFLIGIGKAAVDAEEGDFAWYQGVKISLFDVTDVSKPKEVAKYEIGDRGTDSPVLRDHKALLFDRERHLLVIPVLVAEIDEEKYPNGVPPYAYGDFVWQGAYIFTITESNITLRGRVTHIEDDQEFLKSGYYFSSEYSVERALYIDDFLYTISQKMVKINELTNLKEVNKVKLP
jgi:uncharacterized secreted protein with C-terminal beta-propeller domain